MNAEQMSPALTVSSERLLAVNPCVGCKWQLDPNKSDGHTCIRGAAPLFAASIGQCAKRNYPWPDNAANDTDVVRQSPPAAGSEG